MPKIKSSQIEALLRPEYDKEGNLIEYKYSLFLTLSMRLPKRLYITEEVIFANDFYFFDFSILPRFCGAKNFHQRDRQWSCGLRL
jgi:hypothetical protein